MSHRLHPIYVARFSGRGGCGHQHDTPQQATNCAKNYMHAHPTVSDASIIKVRFLQRDAWPVEKLVSVVDHT